MNYTIAAKATTYNGVNFRSRLEAKWAAFFDLIGWKWEYEPFDCDGWTPDFKITGDDNYMLIEVKPIINEEIIFEYKEKTKMAPKEAMCVLVESSAIFDRNCFGFVVKECYKRFIHHIDDGRLTEAEYKNLKNKKNVKIEHQPKYGELLKWMITNSKRGVIMSENKFVANVDYQRFVDITNGSHSLVGYLGSPEDGMWYYTLWFEDVNKIIQSEWNKAGNIVQRLYR